MKPFHSWDELGWTGFPVSHSPTLDVVDVSVVLPCLNEEQSVAATVAEVRSALHDTGLRFEIIVVDNGSTDRSKWQARKAGASVVHERNRGYGSACRAGLEAATGRYVILGDADGTYDFSAIPDVVRLLDEGADMVLGNRLAGKLERGAMPWLHRRIGTPLISGLINSLFRTDVGDVNCGMRGIKKTVYGQLPIGSTGMEFASEMVVRAAQKGLQIAETPVNYRLRSGGTPKLRTWHDGWRHLKLVLGSWLDSERETLVNGASPISAAEFEPGV
jgi:glycosyltransferase involved in cell wall biosynthesis